jgi:REP element-mobilizing transposase RayT
MNATDTQFKHEYNPAGPAAYFITFHTYGTWLHGDKRGSIDHKVNNIPGTPILSADSSREEKAQSRLKQPPVTLNWEQRKTIESAIEKVVKHNGWVLHAVNARREHVHCVITAPKRPEPVMNQLKSWCTRVLRESELLDKEISPWSRHGSTRYLWLEKDVLEVVRYVRFRQ